LARSPRHLCQRLTANGTNIRIEPVTGTSRFVVLRFRLSGRRAPDRGQTQTPNESLAGGLDLAQGVVASDLVQALDDLSAHQELNAKCCVAHG